MKTATIDANADLYGLAAIQQSIDKLLAQTGYLKPALQQQLIDGCFFAARAHDGQKRRSGEPYICHPIKVAEILAKDVQFDLPVLLAAVLHDVIEDTDVPKSAISEAFSDEVAELVDGVSKLEKDKDVSPEELQARTFAKLVVAMEADPRVVMIKFADRMHNMQTLGALRPDKRRRIARETLDVYVPIATRLGMFVFKSELEELAFRHLYPWRYRTITRLVNETHPEREATFANVRSDLNERFAIYGIKASVRKRRRNLFSTYKKLERSRIKRRPLENASIPLVIITETQDECYRTLGIIHDLYTPVFKKLADYIASAKTNGYQSIHTSVLTRDRRVLNFQIRTKRMHAVAESGIIAIWRDHNQWQNDQYTGSKRRRDKSMRRWLGNIKSLRSMASNPLEFYDAVKRDLIDFEIQVLTPKGEPIALPDGATVIDFAYHIHTDLGNHLESAKVNGVDVPVDFRLSQGQSVELFASPSAGPESVWLKKVKTARARTAIRHCLRDLPADKLTQLGYRELKRHLSKRQLNYPNLDAMLVDVAAKSQLSVDELLQRVALHDFKRKIIRDRLQSLAYQSRLTSAISVRVRNQPGILGAVADTIGRHEVNILTIEFPDDMQAAEVSMTFVVQLALASQLNAIIEQLNQLSLVKNVKYEEYSE